MRLQLLRTDYKGRGPWRLVANALNAIGIVINEAVGENGIELSDRGGRLTISGSGDGGGGSSFPNSKVPFWHSMSADGKSVTMYAGVLSTPSTGNISIAGTTVNLSFGTEFIYIKWPYDSLATIESMGSRPSITSTYYSKTLLTLSLDAESGRWSPLAYNHTGGDVVLSPIT